MKTLITMIAVSIVIAGFFMLVIFPTQESELESIVRESKEFLDESEYAKYVTGYETIRNYEQFNIE